MYEMEDLLPCLRNYNTFTTPPALKLRCHAVTKLIKKVFETNNLELKFLLRVTKLFRLGAMHHRLVCYQITLSPRGLQEKSSFVSVSCYLYIYSLKKL